MTPDQARAKCQKLQRRINKAVMEIEAARKEFERLKYVDHCTSFDVKQDWILMCETCHINPHSEFDDWTS